MAYEKENELLCKIIAYNITVLIREMIEMGATPEFFSIVSLTKELSMIPADPFFKLMSI